MVGNWILPNFTCDYPTEDITADGIQELYERALGAAIEPRIGTRVTQFSTPAMRHSIYCAQQEFLSKHLNYVPSGPISVTWDGRNSFSVSAPICTISEKIQQEMQERDRVQLLAILEAEWLTAERIEAKRLSHLTRRHRILTAKHYERVPYRTKLIWDTLTLVQQYAVLKDIDYAVRHSNQNTAPAP